MAVLCNSSVNLFLGLGTSKSYDKKVSVNINAELSKMGIP